MKNKLIKILVLTLIPFFIIGLTFYFIVIHQTLYNTVYSRNYNPNNFNLIKVGVPLDKVISLLGEPIKIYEIDYSDCITYNEKQLINIKGYIGETAYDNTIQKALFICFYENGNVKNVNNNNLITKDFEYEIKNMKKEEIFNLIGLPYEETSLIQCSVLLYSYLKEGNYNGKNGIIDIRWILIEKENNTVYKIINKKGSAFNLYYNVVNHFYHETDRLEK